MNDKQQLLTALRDIFNRWEELLSGLTQEQSTAREMPSDLSIKDVVAHMMAWQQISAARALAALYDREPEFPAWWHKFGPDPEEDVDRTNAWIHETYLDKPWPAVHADWRSQFLRYLQLTQEIPDRDLFERGRYPWMGGYALSDSLQGSYEHHQEHLDGVLAWLRDQGE